MAAPSAPSRAKPARAGDPSLPRMRNRASPRTPAGTAPHARAFVAGRPEAAIKPAREREISVSVRLGRTTVTPSRSGRCSVSSSSSCIPPPKTVRQRRNVSARAPLRVKLSRYKQAKLNSQNLLNITTQARGVNHRRKVNSRQFLDSAAWAVDSNQRTRDGADPVRRSPAGRSSLCSAHADERSLPFAALRVGISAGGSRCAHAA